MIVSTTRFGELEIDSEKIITFPKGIPGFENLHQFIIIPVEGTEDIHWLQSVESPGIALMVIDPFKFVNGYACAIPEPDIAELELEAPGEALILTTITIPRDNPAQTTTNLVAPIVINTRLNLAKQVIMSGSPYQTKHLLFQGINKKGPHRENQKASGGEGK
ncbi:flagellar assembly protein FliW [Desulfotruncus alcoholivorax]|uniref:flagellar assembly protein FliW n=1 Tax=Desulfotruncus alcoholivorax TaxID=265477 RepID=UPI0004882E93|nr:flagellar assembly protein FliW [Desulfotruncus alcoholivorax]